MNKLVRFLFVAALLLVFNAKADITDGLVSYWPLDVIDTGATPDLSFGNAMTVVGSPTVGSGQFSNSFTFIPATTYLTNLHDFDNGATGLPIFAARSYTVSLWVKGAAQTAKYLYAEGNTTTTTPLFVLQTGNAAAANSKLDVIIRTDGGVSVVNHAVSTNVVFDNNWHHIAWVDDRGTVKLYIDGNLDPANFSYDKTYTDFSFNTSAIGTLVRTTVSTANIFNGQIDEVALWERPLSQAEVNQVRTNGVYTPGTAVPPRATTLVKAPADAAKRMGDWHLFSVNAAGNRPLNYQWSSNGVAIVTATNRTFLVTGLQTNNSGDFYSVTVTNAYNVAPTVTTNATLTIAADAEPDLPGALLEYWPLDVFDALTNSPELHFGHSMVMVNMDTNLDVVAGEYSNSVFFVAGRPSYGYRTNGSSLFSRTNYSVSLWVNGDFTSQNDRRVFSEGSTTSANPLFSLGTDNAATPASPGMTVFTRGDNNVNTAIVGRKSTRPVFDNLAWHFVVWTDNNGQGKLYIDGNLDETDYTYTRVAITLNTTSIGAVLRSGVGNAFTGEIDDVATWNRVLSWTEVQKLRTNGVPIPQGIVAPIILNQPPNRTNGVYVADNVTFPVLANGTLPFVYQWFRNGTAISGAVNPSALTDTLSLTNVQLADSNTTYSLIITNASGSVTSSVVRLYVTPWTAQTNGEVAAVDIDLTGLIDIQPGFSEMTIATNPAVFNNALRITLAGIGAPLADRHRSVADARYVVNNPPFLTQAQLYNDFVFANSANDATGLSILIDRLAPNTPYGVTIWSFDPVSGGVRAADWTETSSGTPIPITNSWVVGGVPVTVANGLTYTFDGTVVVTNDFAYTLGALLTSSATGTLQIQGLRDGGTGFGVFLNAVRLVAHPAATTIIASQFLNGNLRITVQGEYPGQPINLVQKADLAAATWDPAVGAVVAEVRGPLVIFDIPITGSQLFYRATTVAP